MRKFLLLSSLCLSMVLLAQDTMCYLPYNVSSPAQFPGGDHGLQQYIAEHTVYPKEAFEKNITGKVKLMFTIDTKGEIVDLKNLDTTIHPALVAEGFRVIQSTNGMWTPAYKENEKVRMLYSIPIHFQLSIDKEPKREPPSRVEHDLYAEDHVRQEGVALKLPTVYQPYEVTEEATFPGGRKALLAYIASNIVYPTSSLKKEESGTITLRFEVGKYGQISNIKQLNAGGASELIEEARRVILSTSGMWVPAKKKGQKVDMVYITPVLFELP